MTLGSETFAICSRCQYVIFTTGVMAIVSIGIGNALVLLRVLVLWQDNTVRPALRPPGGFRRLICSNFLKRITRLLWGGYFLSFVVMTSLMFFTCAKALREFRSLPRPACRRSLRPTVSRLCVVADYEDVCSDNEGAVPRSHMGRLGTCGATKVFMCRLTDRWPLIAVF